MSIKIKRITKNEMKAYIKIQQQAYPTYYQGNDAEVEKMLPGMNKRLLEEDLFFYGAFIDDVLVGEMLYLKFKMNFHGELIDVHGIGSVAVSLLHKKKGIAKALVLFALDTAEKEKIPMFSLYPFRPDFYENFGFGFGSKLYEYQIKPQDFNKIGNLKYLTENVSKEEINAFYESQLLSTHGRKRKSSLDLSVLNNSKVIVYKEDDVIYGYMYYKQEKQLNSTSDNQKIVVEEMIYSHVKALHSFSTFFSVQQDQVDFIQLFTYDENFHHLLNNYSYASGPKLMPYVSHKTCEVGVGLMWRSINIEKLLQLISKKTTFNVKFQIREPEGFVHGYSINHRSEPSIELSLSLSSFSSWIMGNISLKDLYTYGKLEVDHAELLQSLDYEFNFDSPKCLAHF